MASKRAGKNRFVRRPAVAATARAATLPDMPEDQVDGVDELRELLAALERVRDGGHQVGDAEERLAEAVAFARALGASWQRVGQAVHLTAEGARRRWGR